MRSWEPYKVSSITTSGVAMKKILKDNGLTIVLLLLFLGSIVGHGLTGWHFQNQQLQDHGEQPITLLAFLKDPQFLSTVFENWESEFLQMSAYVVLTAFLFQRGSAESPIRMKGHGPTILRLEPQKPVVLLLSTGERWCDGFTGAP